MNENNIIIGIEGMVGAGKTSISQNLLNYIPNSIILHGGNIYRAIVYQMMQSGIKLDDMAKKMKNVDILSVLKQMDIDIKVENRETVIYINNKKIDEEQLQSKESSMAVSMISNIADNSNLYKFGRDLIDKYKENYNIILSSRDIMKMYPNSTYHFFITADLKERVNRKYIQYNNKISKEEIETMINTRDQLQEKSGYYAIYDKTILVDVTNCNTVEESTQEVLKHIKVKSIV